MIAADTVPLGRTGIAVSRLGFGSGPIGGLYSKVSPEDARATVRRALDHGIRLFDTAPLYGLGLSERRLGASLRGVPRGDFAIACKVGRLLVPAASLEEAGQPGTADFDRDESYLLDGESMFKDDSGLRPVWDYSQAGVLRSIEESLDRLELDRLDIAYVHDPEEHMDQAITEAIPALRRLREEGAVRAVGVATDHAWAGIRFARETDIDCLLIAGRWTLLDRSALVELLPLCEQRGIAVVAASVFNSGLLADPIRSATFWYLPASPPMVEQARAMEAVCARYGVPLRAAAIQFAYRHPAVASVLVGVRSPREVDENVAAVAIDIPEKLWTDLDAVSAVPRTSG